MKENQTVYILFESPLGDFRKVVEATDEEWKTLVRPASESLPSVIDGSTVDEDMRDQLLGRKEVVVPNSESIDHVVLMV